MSTLERWHFAARQTDDPVAALRNRRRPQGHFAAMPSTVVDGLVTQYRMHPGWSAQLHLDNLRVALAGAQPLPSYSTVRRYLKAQGISVSRGSNDQATVHS